MKSGVGEISHFSRICSMIMCWALWFC